MTVEMLQINSDLNTLEGTTTAEMVLFLDEAQYIDSSEIQFGEYYKPWDGYGIYLP